MYIVLMALLLLAPIPIYFAFKSLRKDNHHLKIRLSIKKAYKRVKRRHSLVTSESHRSGNRLIAIDQQSRKLVFIVFKNGITWEKCVPLQEILSCSVVNGYDKATGCIQHVALELMLANGQGIITFPFFDEETDDRRELPFSIKRIRYWEKKINFYSNASTMNSTGRQIAAIL